MQGPIRGRLSNRPFVPAWDELGGALTNKRESEDMAGPTARRGTQGWDSDPLAERKNRQLNPTFSPPVFRICGVKIHAVQVPDLLPIVQRWMESDRTFHYVSSTNAYNAAIALDSPEYFEVLEQADISMPDGVPFLWYGRTKGFPLRTRCGIEELMEVIFDASNAGASYSHFFYGNTPEVLENLKAELLRRYPNLRVAGMHSPPFRELTPEEDEIDVKMINDSGADFLWVSLGCPKQEQWLYDRRDRLHVVAGGGAGAVFNFLTGETSRAPKLVRQLGLEWVYRLAMEPQRLFSRYCVRYPIFVLRFLMYEFRSRRTRALSPRTTGFSD